MGGNTRLVFPTGIAVDAGGRTYVANKGSNGNYVSVTVYAAGATGNATPIAMIAGSFPNGLQYPQGIAVDAGGKVYVADGVYPAGKIWVYTPDATGKFAPAATIAGANTGLGDSLLGIAEDAAGRVYVASGNAIMVFTANATGNATPVATIGGSNGGLGGPTYLTF